MARISFDALQETVTNNNSENTNNNGIKLFSLKNDGDVAIVRIMHDSVEDFDILTTHKIKVGDKRRNISCIRNPHEPIDNCPLCKSGEKIQQRFYIHMIQYKQNPKTNAIEAVPVVWDRAATEYANKFKTLIEEYGPLSNQIFKIKRNGKAGDMSTTYEVLFGSPNMYPEATYPKIDAFKDYTALGKVVMDKNYQEICQFMATGQFPQTQRNNNTTQSTAVGTTNVVPQGTVNPRGTVNIDVAVEDPATYTTPVPNTVPTTNNANAMPWDTQGNNVGVNRPVRRY